MDPVSHALVGSAIGALAPGAAPGLLWATVAGAVAPDIDFVIQYGPNGQIRYLDHHRGPTHGPLGLAALGLAITGLLVWLYPQSPPGSLLLWTLLGLASHVLLDLTNAYGTQALWPFRRTRYAWDWTSVVDPVVAGLPAAGWAAVWLGLPRGPVFTGALLLTALYILLRARVHGRLLQAMRARYPQAHRISVVPELLGINRWRYIVEQGNRYATGQVTWRPLRAQPVRELERAEDEVIGASRQAPSVQVMLRFARHPHASWWRDQAGHYVVRWTELRYDYGKFSPFTAYAYLDRQLNLIDDRLYGDRKLNLKEGWAMVTGRATGEG